MASEQGKGAGGGDGRELGHGRARWLADRAVILRVSVLDIDGEGVLSRALSFGEVVESSTGSTTRRLPIGQTNRSNVDYNVLCKEYHEPFPALTSKGSNTGSTSRGLQDPRGKDEKPQGFRYFTAHSGD